jgi:hypothetical protein
LAAKPVRFVTAPLRGSSSEGELHPELHHATASRTDERIAGSDVGCGAPATERAGGAHVISSTGSSAIAIRCTVRIRDDRVIEQVKELDPELGVVPFFEREVFEYGKIHVLEGGVAEDVPAHRSKSSPRRRNQNRFMMVLIFQPFNN